MIVQGSPAPFDDADLALRGLIAGQGMFGRYVLRRLLGRGRMGVVWLATDEELRQEVALKFLPEVVATDPAALDQLRNETTCCLELAHPHIVRLHGLVCDEQHVAIATEFVDGETLAHLGAAQPKGVFEPAQLLGWIEQMAGALDHAHFTARIVHGDLQPANLMVDAHGSVKITDFGISAKISDALTRAGLPPPGSGSAAYMSPQQMRGEIPVPVDDVYSLGATIFALLTGKPPFFRGDIPHQVLDVRPPLVAARRAELGVGEATIPPAWEKAIAACLEKEPARRPRCAGEMLAVLKGRALSPPAAAAPAGEAAPASLLDGDSGTARAPARAPRSKIPVWLGAVAALALAGGLAWYYGFRNPGSDRPAPAAATAEVAQVTAPVPTPPVAPPAPEEPPPPIADSPAALSPGAPPSVEEAAPAPPAPALRREFVLTVDPPEAGAHVWFGRLSDVAVEDGRLALTDLPDGEHELIVQAPGYLPFSTMVSVSGGRGEATARLIAVRGSVELRARPGTRVTAIAPNGEAIALGAVAADGTLRSENVLRVGAYRFVLEHADYARVDIAPQDLLVGRTLSLAPPQSALPGELRVFTVPTGAEVRIDGELQGTTPATLAGVPSGREVNVEVMLRGYRRVVQQVELKPNEVRTLNLGVLVAEAGALEIRFSPLDLELGGARVAIDGTTARPVLEGATWRIDGLEVGRRRLEVNHPDYEPWVQELEVRDRQTTTAEAALQPKPGALTLAVKGPPTFTLRVGGNEVAVAGGRAVLPAGQPLDLELTAAGYQRAQRTLTLAPNGAETWTVALEPLRWADEGRPWTVPKLGLEMVWVAPGSFTMGSPRNEVGRPITSLAESPPTVVNLTRGFWLGQYEVTQKQWKAVMGNNPSGFADVTSDAPVENVSWNDAMEFCRLLTETERAADRLPEGYLYTLPTEAQWEYSCRAGTTGPYAGSGMLENMGWYRENSNGRPHPVGKMRPNAWGLHDMHGNLWEWCLGPYLPFLPGGTVEDWAGPAKGMGRSRRGGGWNDSPGDCRSACRFSEPPSRTRNDFGFRLALAPAPAPDGT